jgi:hypothetical protein
MNLIGRDNELQIVRSHLCAGKNLVIFGEEGVGKTALATEAIRGMSDVLYCADTSTLKTTCESLLQQLHIAALARDNIQRKRAVLNAVANKKCRFVFDHIARVGPKLLSFLENLCESHPTILITRTLASGKIGHLKMILWNFDKMELRNLSESRVAQLIDALSQKLNLNIPDPVRFRREIWQISHGNPHIIIDVCRQAARGHYVFGQHFSTKLMDLDRRINKICHK